MEEQTNKTTGKMTTTGLMDTGNDDSNSRNVINTLSNKKLVAKTGKEATTRITDTGNNHLNFRKAIDTTSKEIQIVNTQVVGSTIRLMDRGSNHRNHQNAIEITSKLISKSTWDRTSIELMDCGFNQRNNYNAMFITTHKKLANTVIWGRESLYSTMESYITTNKQARRTH